MSIKALIFALVVGLFFFGSIWTIADEMGYLALMQHSGRLILILFIPAIIITYFVFKYITKSFEGLDVFRYTGITFVFVLVICQAMGLFINRLSSTDCIQERVSIIEYRPMFVSGHGRLSTDKVANRWELTIVNSENITETYTLKENIRTNLDPSKRYTLEACRSVFGTKMFNSLIGDQ